MKELLRDWLFLFGLVLMAIAIITIVNGTTHEAHRVSCNTSNTGWCYEYE